MPASDTPSRPRPTPFLDAEARSAVPFTIKPCRRAKTARASPATPQVRRANTSTRSNDFVGRRRMMNFRMKCKLLHTLLLIVGIVVMLGRGAHAQTILDYFSFNTSQSQDTGIKTGILSNTFASGDVFLGSNGSATNKQSGYTAGSALYLVGGAKTGSVYPNNGKYLQLQTSSSGYMGLKLSFAVERTSTGFTSNQVSYSTDGTNFTNFGTAYTPADSYSSGNGLQSFDFTSINELNNKTTSIYFRITFDGATAANGANHLDNLLLTASETPAPPGLVSLLIGLCVSGWKARRRKRQAAEDVTVG